MHAPGRFGALRAALPAVLLCVLAACSSDDDEIRPSPIPPGYAMLVRQRGGTPPAPRRTRAPGDTVDELLAIVDGQVLTRREVLRRLQLPEGDRPDRDEEEEIRQARKEWAQQQLVIGAARRAGLQIPPSAVDKIVYEQLDKRIKAFEEQSGKRLTREEYLKERKLTWSEFRAQLEGAIVTEFYLRKLLQGVGKPTRPEIDFDVSPAEVRRIYFDHKEEFDVKRGVRFALFQLPIERFETEERDFLEAEETAQEQAEALAAGFRRRVPNDELARRFGIAKEYWRVSDQFIESFLIPDGQKFLFDPARKVGDAIIFHDAGGPVVLGVVEIRPARERTLNEVAYDDDGKRLKSPYDQIVEGIQVAMQIRLAARLTIDQLNRGSVVWPTELADELLDEAQETLDRLAADEIMGGVRLK